MSKAHSLVSLFSGAGGLDMGFEQAGFETIWANDINKDACKTHKSWSHAKVVCADIKNIDMKHIPQSDVIAGGFPCQGFSLAGPRKIDDSRNFLYKFFVQLVEQKQPKVFIAENVKGILTLGDGAIIENIINEFKDKGYKVVPTLINAADYGVAQDRMRVIIIGVRDDIGREFIFPKPFQKKVTIADALTDLEKPKPEDICMAPFSSRYMSRNRKRPWNAQSFTIPAMAKQCPIWSGSPDMVRIGANNWRFGDGETRRFSWQEAAAIQTFPKDLEFSGSLTSKYLQIGNAVPVKLAYVIAKALITQILDG